ncbi:porin family protein [Hymenobacter cheonanensis]|uniref:porin family protein n=1 Tax=Hymenobacter sp. CA2-7 TaxID=3063993 RepID=UPI00271287CE|nr:porin family protein [Hymenobacter sp. CA2-7]MDO7886730.1 porin family protein [Hymenobacter sp. CA2-7]
MKKLLIGAAAATLLAVAAAPAARAQSVLFGLKAGANLSNLSGDLVNQSQYNNRFGFHGGVMVNFGLANDLISIQPEVLYSQKGFKYADQSYTVLGNTYRNTGSVRYDYLDVPVLVRLKVSGVFFEVGPQYSYLMNISTDRTQTANGNVVGTAGSGTTNLDNVNRNELGYVGGLGFQSSQGFLLGVRYNGAFTDFAKDGYSNNDFRNARNSAFQAYVGVLLGGK